MELAMVKHSISHNHGSNRKGLERTEKKTATYMLVQANDIDQAPEVLKKRMKGTMADYVIAEVKETKIMDVFPYKATSDEEYNNRTDQGIAK